MRANIRDIIKAANCTEEQANKIEQEINNQWLLDWSECSMSELKSAAVKVYYQLYL